MAHSQKLHTELLQSICNWNNHTQVINYLESFNPNVKLSIKIDFENSYNKHPSETSNLHRRDSRPRNFLLPRSNETDEYSRENLIVNEPHTNDYVHLTSSSPARQLSTLFDHSLRTHHSEQMSSSDRRSYLVSNINEISQVLPNIHQFDHNKQQLLRYIDTNIIGKDVIIQTLWGPRKAIYADYTASGRGLTFLEQYILTYVLPFYANTHSENNAFALQTTRFRESARAIIKQCVNATDDDVVIFTGAGSTAAINKTVDILQLRNDEIRNHTVVFVSTLEHHSNILPWQETGVEFIRIPNNKTGLLDQNILKNKLIYYRDQVKKSIICTFNAASNVTGIQADVNRISELVHEYGGRIFWDYAAAAPYVRIDMNPTKKAAKDAVFISTHKFVGGPSTSGLLIAKKAIFNNRVPGDCGGGTVNFVTRRAIEYVKDIETREEGGTPNIVGAIRAGLVFQLKQSVGEDLIKARDNELVQRFFQRFQNNPTLVILGPQDVSRLAIFAFLVYVPSIDKYLHHNLICSILNDLFGIQIRSGCSCAGPYVLDLLDIDDEKAAFYMKFITEELSQRFDEDNNEIPHNALMKLGFSRVTLPYFASDEEINYILDAIDFIASDGWRFLPLYTYNQETAAWYPRHLTMENYSSVCHNLQMINYRNGHMESMNAMNNISRNADNRLPSFNFSLPSCNNPFHQARAISKRMPNYVYENMNYRIDIPLNIPNKYKDFIWFVTPKEIMTKLMIEFDQKQ
ncbi:unnamed protein product [Rotaria magnacalcarata]